MPFLFVELRVGLRWLPVVFCFTLMSVQSDFSAVYAQDSTETVEAIDEKAEAERLMRLAGAIITKDSEDRVIAIQFPEYTRVFESDLVLLEHFPDLQDLDLGGKGLGNECLKTIGKLTELRTLNLFGNPLDSISMTYLKDLQKLETLYLYRTFIDDEGVKSIVKLKSLRRLNMFDTFLTDKSLELFGQCKNLRHLGIGNTKARDFPESFFSPDGIARLRENLPNTNITFWGSDDAALDKPELIGKVSETDAPNKKNRGTALAPTIKLAPSLSKIDTGSDWATFLGPTRDGKSSETELNMDWFTTPPKLLWHQKVGEGFAAPSISNGRLMLYHRVRNLGGEQRFLERISCLQSETGEKVWEKDFPTDYEDLNGYGDGPRSAPVIDGNQMYLLSPEGILRCLQVVDGELVWEVNLKLEYKCDLVNYGVGTTPIVYGNRLIVIVGGQSTEKNAFESSIVALDKMTGVFHYGLGKSAASYATPVICNAHDRPWCFAFTREGLTSFNPDSGKKDFDFPWRSNIAGCVNAATPVVVEERVFISEAYSIGGVKLQFSEAGFAPVWQDSKQQRNKIFEAHWATPIYHEGHLYGCSGRHASGAMLKCISWDSGATVWQKKIPDRSSLTYVDGHFLSLGEGGALFLFEASSTGYQVKGVLGKRNSKVVPSYPAWGAPVIAKGLMYLKGKQELICYDLRK